MQNFVIKNEKLRFIPIKKPRQIGEVFFKKVCCALKLKTMRWLMAFISIK